MLFCNTAIAASNWVSNNYALLASSEVVEKRKAASNLSSHYTDNGARGNVKDIINNFDILRSALNDNDVSVIISVTEILAARTIERYPEPSIISLNLFDSTIKHEVSLIFLKNLKSSDQGLSITSAKALINLKKCEFSQDIIQRFENGTKNEKNKFKYLSKSLNRNCNLDGNS